jgi:hypothetical protein
MPFSGSPAGTMQALTIEYSSASKKDLAIFHFFELFF